MPSIDIPSTIINTASSYGVDPRLALEVAMRESRLNPAAVNPSSGAIGIFQLMPATAADLGVDPHDPAQNIDGGVRYLAQMIAEFGGDVAKGLAAYDWGPEHLKEAMALYGQNWLSHAPGETQNYVSGILSNVGSEYTVSPSFAPSASGAEAGTPAEASTTGEGGWIALFIGVALLGLWLYQD